MGGRTTGGQDVGNAQGRITIDTSGMVTAQRVVTSSSQAMTASMNRLNAPIASIAQRFRDADQSARDFAKSDLGQVQKGVEGLARSFAPLSLAAGALVAGGLAAAGSVNRINASFTIFLGSAKAAQKELQNIRNMADETGQPFLELAESAASLLSLSKAQNVEVGKLVTLGQQLKAVDPTARAIDVSLATREFLSGNARSLYSRFEGLDKKTLDDILKGATNAQERLDGLQKYLNRLGFSTDILKQFGQSGAYAFGQLSSEITEALATAFTPLLTDFVLPAVKGFSSFVRGLREANPALLQVGAAGAVLVAGIAPALLLVSQLISAFRTLQTVAKLPAIQGLGKVAGIGVAGFLGAQVGSLGAKALAGAGVKTGDLGRVAQGEDPLAIVGERLKQGLVVLVAAVLDGTKFVVQGFAFVGSLIKNGGTVISAAFDAFKAQMQLTIANLSQFFGDLFVQLANNFSGLFDTTKLREFGTNLSTVGKFIADDAQAKLTAAGNALLPPVIQASLAAKEAGDAFQQSRDQIVTGLSQGLGLIPTLAEETQAAADAMQAVKEAANPLATAFAKNQEAIEAAAQKIVGLKADDKRQTDQQKEDRGIQAAREEFDTNLQRARSNRDFQQQLAQDDLDFYRNRERSIADFNKDLLDTDLQGQEQIARTRADNAEQEIQIAKDHGKRLLEIEQNTKKAVRDAASTLDAKGVFNALQNGQEQIDQESKNYDTAKERRLKDQDDQLAELVKSQTDQHNQRIAAFQTQLNDQQAAHDENRTRTLAANAQRIADEEFDRQLRRTRQQEDYDLQDRRRREALNRQINDIINGLATETSIRKQWIASFVNSLVAAGGHVKDFAAFINTQLATLPQTGSVTNTGGKIAPTAFASGGKPPYVRINERGMESALFSNGRMALFTNPATILPAAQTASLLGGGGRGIQVESISPTIVLGDIGSMSHDEIKSLVMEGMVESLDALKALVG